MTTKRNAFDPSIIDHTNEDLMRYYYLRLADEAGIARRAAEVMFRNSWDTLHRKFTSDREDTFRVMRIHIEGAKAS